MNRSNVVLPDKLGRDTQTGQLAYWDGTQFQLLPDEDGDGLLTTMRCLLQIAVALQREVASLRQGMIEKGMCEDFDPLALSNENT
jgi:hypothetical protein